MDSTQFEIPDIATTIDRNEDLTGLNKLKSKIAKLKLDKEEHKENLLLSQSIIKRRNWMEKYKISEKIIFELFSEFSSMMLIHKRDEEAGIYVSNLNKTKASTFRKTKRQSQQ